MLYQHFQHDAAINHVFAGLAAAASGSASGSASGLQISMALKMLVPLLKKPVLLMVAALFFIAMFALAQAGPGPNMMIVTLVGWHVAGWPGVLVTTLAKFGPSSLLTGVVLHLWRRFKDRPWRATIQAGLVPMTVGLVAASAALITEASAHTWELAAIAASFALVTFKSKIHPLWVLAAGALLGLSGIGQF